MSLSLQDRFELLLDRIFQFLPLTWVSGIGGFLGARQGKKAIAANRLWVGRMHVNLQKIWGVDDPIERERRIIAHTRHVGQVYAEIAVMPKLVKSGRLKITGQENLENLTKPVILVSAHIGNWELMGHVAELVGGRFCDIYLPLDAGAQAQIVQRTRASWRFEGGHGVDFIPAQSNAMRHVSKAVANGSNVVLFIDEEKDGFVFAPSLGRTIPYAGNRWFAARLAVKYQLDILPVVIEPAGLGRYRAVIEPKISVHAGSVIYDPLAEAKVLADELNSHVERWVRQWPDYWYWLPLLDLMKNHPNGGAARNEG